MSVTTRIAASVMLAAVLVAGCTATPAGHPSDSQVTVTGH